jgi:hypothetical protein
MIRNFNIEKYCEFIFILYKINNLKIKMIIVMKTNLTMNKFQKFILIDYN